jgi:hypothetical protein
MKNLSKVLIGVVVIICCCETACNKQEDSFMPGSRNNNSINPLSLKSRAVFTVSPSADLKDSYAIQKAFNDAVAAGPGSTVQLTKGIFCLDKRIEVEGFVGCFKGAGKEKTIITTPLDKPVDFSLPDPDWESLIKFRHGDINVSDFTIKISNPHPCTGINPDPNYGWTDQFPSLIMFTGNSVNDVAPINPVINFTLNNVNFIGLNVLDEFAHYNVGYCIDIYVDGYDQGNWHGLTGSYKITNCEFKSFYNCIASCYNGKSETGDNNNYSGNKFEDAIFGVMYFDCSNAIINISNNRFTKMYYAAIQLVQGYYGNPTSLSKYLIRNNFIESEIYYDAIWLADLAIANGEGKRMDVNVSNNNIYLNNVMSGGGIFGMYAKDALVRDNKIWGNGIAGIYSSDGDEMSGWFIKGNNVQEVNAQVAPIWLNSSSHDNTVIGSSLSTTVLDEGSNNILINVNRKHWDNTPQEIHDKLMRHNEMINSFRGHRR